MNTVRPLSSADPAHFRRVMGRFASGVTVITASVDGDIRGMTANAFMSGSLDPPLCVVSVAKRAHMHAHLQAAGAFSVNILAAGQEEYATNFAGRPVEGLRVGFREINGIPAIVGTSGLITAKVAAKHDCGDHSLFIGAIVSMAADDQPPLLYHASRFAALVPLREASPALPEFW
jgi:flavin reductase (DIM6/NTAB) family NADH-FMN oxidoreductase RutF